MANYCFVRIFKRFALILREIVVFFCFEKLKNVEFQLKCWAEMREFQKISNARQKCFKLRRFKAVFWLILRGFYVNFDSIYCSVIFASVLLRSVLGYLRFSTSSCALRLIEIYFTLIDLSI